MENLAWDGQMYPLVTLQQALARRATLETKTWWENYLRHSIPFRGVKMDDIRVALHEWLVSEGLHTVDPLDRLIDLALGLLTEPYAEDKLAGILLLHEVLLPAGAIDWPRDLPRFAVLFQVGAIADWNTCDWFCVRVLGPLVDLSGEECARAIAGWRTAESVWQRRAAGVAFVNLVHRGDTNFPGFTDMLLEVCTTTVQSPERFAQTGTGWILRELSLAEPTRVATFIQNSIHLFSRQGLRSATKKLPEDTRVRLLRHP